MIILGLVALMYLLFFIFMRDKYLHSKKYYYDLFGERRVHPFYKNRRLSNFYLGDKKPKPPNKEI